jgi:putative ABC transport system permease protein
MDWKARIRAELHDTRSPADDDVIEELAQHASATYERARADGSSQADADARVMDLIERWRLEADALRHRSRRQAAMPPPSATATGLASAIADLRYAVRLLWRQPAFALLVVLTMALGIGATTTLFGVTYGVLMKPLPWPAADRVVVLKETRGGRAPRFGSFSNAAYAAWREHPSTIDEIAAWTPQTFTLTGIGDPERIRATAVTASLFRALGVRPLIGTLFDDKDETSPLVVLSEGLWRQRFGGDPDIAGRIIQLDGTPRTVTGVVADAFAYPDGQARAWVPFRVAPTAGNMLMMFEAVARLQPGRTIEQAEAEAAARGQSAADTGMTTMAIFGGDGPIEVAVRPLRDAMTGDVRRPLIVLLAAVALLLVIATTNVASLQLARATTRRRELAIRAALGASSGRAMRQLLAESLVLGGIGGAAGLGLAWLLNRGAAAILPADFPRVHDLAVDTRVALFAVVISILSSVVFGLLPALQARRMNLVQALAEDGTSPVGFGRRSRVARNRLVIIGGQVAIACVLLVGAALLGRSFVALLHADRGFDPAFVLSAPIVLPGPAYTPARRLAAMQAIITRIAAAPAVRHAAFTSEAPWMTGGSTSSFTLPARQAGESAVAVQASPRLVSPGYFAALGLRVVLGRSLDESDTEASQPVVVVNETFARRYLGDKPLDAVVPLGVWGGNAQGSAAVVGIVEDVRYVRASVTSLPEMYFPYRQVTVGMRSTTATLLIRGDARVGAIAGAIRTAVREVDPALVPGPLMTVQDRLLATSLARPRLYAMLLASFAAAALIVTGVGLFGVLSYTVAQRTRELVLRAALGARRGDLVALVVRQGLGITLAGLAAGLLASAWLTRFMTTLLYGVSAHDWPTYVAVALVLLAVAAMACLAPARRAARLDPLRALRS